MKVQQLHRAQASILWRLKYCESARFSELMRQTNLTSDSFKFHVQKLIKLGYISKNTQGHYTLTAQGKEVANDFDIDKRVIRKHPKVAVLIVAERQTSTGETRYLFQKRARNPYFGFWSEITMSVMWGESFEEAAQQVLRRHTGLTADFTVRGARRIRDFEDTTDTLLEDKLFIIMHGSNIEGNLTKLYAGGENRWLTLKELESKELHFSSSPEIIKSLLNNEWYAAQDIAYEAELY